MKAAMEVQKALFDALSANGVLIALLGGPHILDDLPERTDPPYILFGVIESLDRSTATEDGEEHFLELEIWSAANGRKQAAQIAGEVCASTRMVCEGLPAALNNHHLINLTVENTVSERAGRERLFKTVVTIRAVTEPVFA